MIDSTQPPSTPVSVLGFALVDDGPGLSLVPEIDGRSLIDLVSTYETAQGHRPAGGYAGIVPDRIVDHVAPDPLRDHYLGVAVPQRPKRGAAWLLARDCGELGCWPLEASVTVSAGNDGADDTVMWSAFRQPHRPAWTYEGLGPFRFARSQVDSAVADAVEALLD